jgi:hypothetical protein
MQHFLREEGLKINQNQHFVPQTVGEFSKKETEIKQLGRNVGIGWALPAQSPHLFS